MRMAACILFLLVVASSVGCNKPTQDASDPVGYFKPLPEVDPSMNTPRPTWNWGTPPSEPVNRNPLGLLDHLGRPVKTPYSVGDIAKTKNNYYGNIAILWFSPDDHKVERWIKTPGIGEGNRYDNYVKKMISEKRILPLRVGTQVGILDLRPHPDKKYMYTYFQVEVLDGEFQGQQGWLSCFGLEYRP